MEHRPDEEHQAEQAWIEEKIGAAERRHALLAEIARRLILAETPRELLAGIFSDLARELGVEYYFNYMVDPDSSGLVLESSLGLTPEQEILFSRLAYGQALCGLAAQRQEPILVADVQLCDLYQAGALKDMGVRAYACHLLKAGSRFIGTLSFASRHRGGYDSEELQLMRAVCDQVAAVMERTRLTNELKETASRFTALADNIAQLAWMADASGAIFWFNKRWYEYTGATQQEVTGSGWLKLHHPDYAKRVLNKLTHSFETGEVWEDTFPLRGRDGTYRWFLSRAIPIRNAQGDIERWCGTNTDITEQKEAQEELARAKDLAEAANRAKTQFLANMSHEMRTPLAAVLGMVELVHDMELGAEQRRLLEVAMKSGKSLLRLISDILEFSSIDARKLKLEKRMFSVRACVQSAVDVVAVKAQEKQLQLQVEIEDEVPEQIEGDERRLRQVLVNILGNAVKFTHEGMVELAVRHIATSEPFEKHHLLFVIRDTGIGIPAEKLENVFVKFTQADTSNTRRYGGAGLGLALSKRIIERMGGKIWVESSEGKGSTFFFFIPLH